ncbi:hypothetical protein MYAM1_000409 [Malassezia yamatoensis]|uniref:DNA-directed RNA polymerase III subunit RPC9 n=1 Tax=Malassezia yamatoensis TaxID=253288 RepID=A0AAJ6CFY9_9BASI|nr:hypothetical protein MYAM1_000409 [Malassezia yamatoensis]
MRIIKARAALLSDYEVLQLLQDTQAQQRSATRTGDDEQDAWMKAVPPNVRTIQFEVSSSALIETIASLSQVHRPCATQNAEKIQSFLTALTEKGYAPPDTNVLQGFPGLTKAERLQLVNHAPTSVVELHTLVEELGQRLNDEQIEDILRCVADHLPTAQEPAEGPLTHEPAPMLEEASQSYQADNIAMDEDAFPEEHFEHEGPGVKDDEDEE